MSQVGRKHRSSSCCSFPRTPRVPLLASPWGDLSYPGGKLSKRNLSMLSSTPLFFLLPAGNTFCSSGGGVAAGSSSALIQQGHDQVGQSASSWIQLSSRCGSHTKASYSLSVIHMLFWLPPATLYPLFSSQFAQSSSGSRKAIHWVPPKTLNRP